MQTQILREVVNLTEARLDREARTVDVTLIRPGWSANGRYYSRDVLAQAAALFEGVKAYANHPTPDQLRRGEGRSVLDITGDYTSVYLGEGGELKAKRAVFGAAGESIWPLIERSVETGRPVIGLSINAVGRAVKGKTDDGKEGIIVEAITAAHSVDDVTEPAAGGGFDRLTAGVDDTLTADLLAAVTYDEWYAARPEFVESLKKQMKRERQDDAVRAAETERDQAKSALVEAQAKIAELERIADEHRAAQAQAERAAALVVVMQEAKAKLPADWLPDVENELKEADQAQWSNIIEREARKAAAIKQPVHVTGAPPLVASPIRTTKTGPERYDMTRITSPEQLLAEQRRLGGL